MTEKCIAFLAMQRATLAEYHASVAQLMACIQETRQGASDNKENKLVKVTCLSLIK